MIQLAFIEAHLAVYGYVGRRDLLGCSKATATKVLSKYRKLHLNELLYSKAKKRYTCTLAPRYHLKVDARHFLEAYGLVNLQELYPIVLDGGHLAYILDGQTVPLLRSFRHKYKPEVGGYYCVPFQGAAFYLNGTII